MATDVKAAEQAVFDLLTALGQNPGREGLRDTPARVVRALMEVTQGERVNPASLLETSFASTRVVGVEARAEVVACAGIEFASTCEHHLLPFTGRAFVAYEPRIEYDTAGARYPRVLGLSKLPRLVEVFARRLQLQERMTDQIADALDDVTAGAAVIVRAEHSCARCRGVRKVGLQYVTQAYRGALRAERDRVLALEASTR